MAALTIAVSQIIRKQGLKIYNEPSLGLTIEYAFSLLLYLIPLFFADATRLSLSLGKNFQLFWKPGVLLSLGWILAFYALSIERFSVVAPLVQTEPLFVVFFSYLYLKELEHTSARLVISAVLVVFGVILVGT